jgi:hypothetical protein
MEEGLTKAFQELYFSVTSENVTPKDICLQFSRIPITKPLAYTSSLYGKLPSCGHILEEETPEDNPDVLLTGVR